MCAANHNAGHVSADMTLADLLGALWQAKRSIMVGVGIGLVAAILFLLASVPHYRITMLVAPAERASRTDIKALLPDNPSFALQYLVNSVGAQDSTDFVLFENMLRAPRVAAILMRDEQVVDGLARPGRFVLARDGKSKNAADLSAQLEDRVQIMPVGNTPLRRVVIDHASAEFGQALLTRLYNETDRLIRADIAAKAQKRSVYLKDMLSRVQHPDHRRALTSLLMEQEHILMLLAIDEPFAAMIVEPPSVSPRPYWPRRGIVLCAFMLAGGMIGFTRWSLKRGFKQG
jgi:predicted RNA-binding protein YlxR (DUF448 family)